MCISGRRGGRCCRGGAAFGSFFGFGSAILLLIPINQRVNGETVALNSDRIRAAVKIGQDLGLKRSVLTGMQAEYGKTPCIAGRNAAQNCRDLQGQFNFTVQCGYGGRLRSTVCYQLFDDADLIVCTRGIAV